MDISILCNKRPKVRNRALHTLVNQRRQKEGAKILFINSSYLDKKNSFGTYSLHINRFNGEGNVRMPRQAH